MPLNINQTNLLKNKIYPYLETRQRYDTITNLEGMCNGARLLLLANCYEAIDAYYKQEHPQSSLFEAIKTVLDAFFAHLEILAAITVEDPKDPAIIKKNQIRDSIAWHDAKQKLNIAIDKNKMNFSELDVTKPRYQELIRLATKLHLLNNNEAAILQEAYIPDMPLIEEFLNEIILLQFSLQYLNISQNDFTRLFRYLYQQTTRDENAPLNIKAPMIEAEYDLVLTPLELLERAPHFIPANRIATIDLPNHAIAAIRIGDNIQFFDSNDKERLPFENIPEVIIFILARYDIAVKREELKKNLSVNVDKIKSLGEQLWLLERFEKIIIAKKNPVRRVQLIKEHLNLFPDYLGLSVAIYKHPDQPRLDKEIELQLNMTPEMFNRADSQGETPLWKASYNGHYQIVKKILDLGISPNTKTDVTAFYVAAQNGHLEILKLLKNHGIDINVANDDGRTALYTAVLHNYEAIVKWLLENNADVNLGKIESDRKVTTPLMLAAQKGLIEMIKLLILYQTTSLNLNSLERDANIDICHSKKFGLFDQVLNNNREAARSIRDTLRDPQHKIGMKQHL